MTTWSPAYFTIYGHSAHRGAGRLRSSENAYAYCFYPPEEEPHFHCTFGTNYSVHPD